MKRLLTILFVITINLMGFTQDFNVRIIKTDPGNFPNVVSSVQVYDSFKEPITNLKDNNFDAAVDGNECESLRAITYKESGIGLDIMLCLDVSGSMNGKPLETMKNAVLKFVDDMRSIDKLGLMGIANDAQLISDFSNDKDYLKDKIKALHTMGNKTALYYGANKGLKKLIDNKEKAGKILMLISDGKNESVSHSFTEDDVIELAKKNGIPVFSIGYTKIDPSYLHSLERISEKTNGNFYNSPSDKDLNTQYQKLYRQILNIYLVNYSVVGVPGDGGKHTNAITVNYLNSKKTVSNEFVAPAGIPEVPPQKVTIEKPSIPVWYYGIGGGIIILIIIAIFIIRNSSKKKKDEEARRKIEEERKKNDLIEAERKKRIELEKKLEEANKPKANQNNIQQMDNLRNEGKTKIEPKVREEKTIILKNDQQKSNVGTNLILEILVGINQGKRFNINTSGATIGRSNNNNIVIKEETVSTNHSRITYSNGNFFIEDLGSSNGTFINGKQIQKCQINHGDVFKFGKCEGSITIY